MTRNPDYCQRIADRRVNNVDYSRRKFIRRGKTFVYNHEIYLSDTNAYGNVYFASFVMFIGEAREDFLAWFLGENLSDFMKSGVGLVTVDTYIKYKLPLYTFDKIEVLITVPKLTKAKLYLDFEIKNQITKAVHATAKMTVGAALGNKAIALPDIFVNSIKKQML